MPTLILILTALFGSMAFACGEDTAYRRVQEEARALGGEVKSFAKVDDGVYQGVVSGRIQTWNGREIWTTFVVDIDKRCAVDVWRAERR